jgi:hypothetical protein
VKTEIENGVGVDDNAAAATMRFLQSRGTEEKFSLLWVRQQATYFVTAKVHFTWIIIVSKGRDYSGWGTLKSLPVRCRFQFSPPDPGIASPRRFATIKVPFPPSPTTLTAFYPLLYFVTALYPSLTGQVAQPPEFSPRNVVGLTWSPRAISPSQ